MPTSARRSLPASLLLVALLYVSISFALAQQAPAPNSDATYQQLRSITLSGDAVGVSNLTLKRDAGTFHLKSGTICFLAPVQGKVTGAVFAGDGNLVLDPPSATERRSLSYLTRDSEFVEAFDHMVMRFTDDSYNEIKKASSGASGSCAAQLFQDNLQTVRKKLRFNLDARILQDVLSPQADGLFVAFIHGSTIATKWCTRSTRTQRRNSLRRSIAISRLRSQWLPKK